MRSQTALLVGGRLRRTRDMRNTSAHIRVVSRRVHVSAHVISNNDHRPHSQGLTGYSISDEKRRDEEETTMQNGNPHMRGTIQVVRAVLELGDDISPFLFCAITNAAKCTATDGRRDMVPDVLFDNCRSLARAELEILSPQIVVTQGVKARNVLSEAEGVPGPWLESAIHSLPVDGPPVRSWLRSLSKEYLRVWRYGSTAAVVLETPHPSARAGQFQRFARVSLGPLAWLTRELLPHASAEAK